jgi:5-enolpyruvylshikimate-3-phosphate synthase
VTAGKIHSVAPYDVVRKMRASVCVLGPLLGRCKEASVALPGGCVIGDRPIDLHLKGFEALGSAVRVEGGDIKVFAPKLRAAQIDMQGKFGPTVLGTDNVMMAAVLADGVTVIEGAACEPEVVDLANFLNEMGAKIEGAGTNRIVIEGVAELHGAEHRVIPDRIEAGTFLVAGAIAWRWSDGKTRGAGARACSHRFARKVRLRRGCRRRFHFVLPNGEASALEIVTRTLSWFPDRHAGANVRVAFDEQRERVQLPKMFFRSVICTSQS